MIVETEGKGWRESCTPSTLVTCCRNDSGLNKASNFNIGYSMEKMFLSVLTYNLYKTSNFLLTELGGMVT